MHTTTLKPWSCTRITRTTCRSVALNREPFTRSLTTTSTDDKIVEQQRDFSCRKLFQKLNQDQPNQDYNLCKKLQQTQTTTHLFGERMDSGGFFALPQVPLQSPTTNITNHQSSINNQQSPITWLVCCVVFVLLYLCCCVCCVVFVLSCLLCCVCVVVFVLLFALLCSRCRSSQ